MLNATEVIEKKFQPLSHISTYNVVARSPSEKSKPIAHIYDGQYFEILVREGSTLVVRCNICGPDGPQLRASTKSSGNILKHIQRRHTALMDTIKLEKNIKSRTTRFEKQRPNKKVKLEIKSDSDSKYLHTNDLEISYAGIDGNHDEDHDDTENHDDDVHDIQEESPLTPEEIQQLEHDAKHSGGYITVDHGHHDVEMHRVEESMLDERNYSTYSKPSDVEVFDEELPYDQNGASQSQHSQPLRHFNSVIVSQSQRLRHDRDLVEFQKQLMQKEFDEVRAMRQEKHKLEMEILAADLKHKYIEHQKKLEILNKRVLEI